MQALKNDNYSEIKLYSVLNIRSLNFILIKKNQQLHSRSQYWNDNEAATANSRASVSLSYVTIAFNVGRPFYLMDVIQWLQNLDESITNVQNVAYYCAQT